MKIDLTVKNASIEHRGIHRPNHRPLFFERFDEHGEPRIMHAIAERTVHLDGPSIVEFKKPRRRTEVCKSFFLELMEETLLRPIQKTRLRAKDDEECLFHVFSFTPQM